MVRSSWRSLIIPFSLIALVVILFAYRLALTDLILGQGDAFLYFYPYWTAAAEALRAGRIPLWNPDIFMGVPLAANSQVGFFYPLNWPLWLLLPAPYAVSASVVIHLVLAGWGSYLAGRRLWGLDRLPAGLAAILFALGGYLTAQVEHVNQLQGMAWLPWFLIVLAPHRPVRWRLAGTVLLFGLQLTAGHTQTAFITGVGIGVWLLGSQLLTGDGWRSDWRPPWSTFLVLAGGAVLATLLAAVQLLPTLELAGQSSRAGGLALSEVLSFSWHPLLASRSLLPGYGEGLFAEYVALLPVTALLLAVIGAWGWRAEPATRQLLLLLALSLFLALGRFNPVNWLLARLPGFDLFRVPARWLLWYALAMALLAGLGYQRLVQAHPDKLRRPLLLGITLVVGLILWAYLAVPLSQIFPMGAEAPAAYPTVWSVSGWLLELALFWLFASRRQARGGLRRAGPLLVAAIALFLASRQLAYHRNVTAPSVYFSLRPPIARLLALAADAGDAGPAGRYLSQSGTLFDLGDQAELDTIYLPQLDEAALWTLTVATKQQEVIAPNLSLSYGLSAVDGFDGGILPLRNYTLATSLLLSPGAQTTDGRLREFMTGVPDGRFLDLFGVAWLITDKVGDEWHEAEGLNVFYDLKHAATLAPGEAIAVGYISAYEATALRLLASAPPTEVRITGRDGAPVATTVRAVGEGQYQIDFAAPVTPGTIRLVNGTAGDLTLSGLALIDSRDSSFQTLVPGQYRLLYSGDVKIYENLDVLPRAFLVTDWVAVADAEAAVALMRGDFDPAKVAVVTAEDGVTLTEPPVSPPAGQVTIQQYARESMTLSVTSKTPAFLIITEANFPGWEATVNGAPVELLTVDGLFRGVWVPAGVHQVELRYAPAGFVVGRWVTLLALLVLVGLWAWPAGRSKAQNPVVPTGQAGG